MYEQADTEFREFFAVLRELVFDAAGEGELDSDDTLVEVLRPLGAADVTVELVEGEISLAEALIYARGLAELGLEAQAHEVLGAVFDALRPSHTPRWFAVELAPFTAAA